MPFIDLEGWLRSLGLAPYEAAFRENAINEAILPKLTAEDLKDIGVTAVGHRRVLLDAIAALRGERVIGSDDLTQVLEVEPDRQLCRANEIATRDRDLATLGFGCQ